MPSCFVTTRFCFFLLFSLGLYFGFHFGLDFLGLGLHLRLGFFGVGFDLFGLDFRFCLYFLGLGFHVSLDLLNLGFNLFLQVFLGSFFGNVLPARTQSTRCEFCGTTYAEIANSGHVGCANCYSLFADRLNPSIVRIHGNAAHCGKHSKAAELEKQQEKPQKKEETVKDLQAQLEKAVARQDFERAAELRDKIREMEGSK